jgi:hypothetical protein
MATDAPTAPAPAESRSHDWRVRLAPRRPAVARVGVVAIVVVLICALFPAALFGGKVLSNGDVIFGLGPWSAHKPASLTHPSNAAIDDQTYEFTPDLLLTRRALDAGQSPLWNPDQGAGRPLLASLQHAPLFPAELVSLILPFWRSQVLAAALKLLIAALGVYVLGRGGGLRRGPAILAGVAYAFSAYTVSWLVSPIGNSIAMCPWVLAMAGRTAVRAELRHIAGLAVAVGLLCLGGHPETIMFALGAAAVWAVLEHVRARRESRGEPNGVGTGRALVALIAGVLLGVGLAAVMLVPFAELLSLSSGTSRGGQSYGANMAYSFFFPQLWGDPTRLIGDFGPINYPTRTGYLGALSVVLAAGGLLARRPRGVHLNWLIFTVLAAFVVIANPIHSLLAGLPVLDRTNLLSTMFLFVLGSALLAGFGLQAFMGADAPARRRVLIGAVAVTLLPAVFLLRHTNPVAGLGTALGQLPSLHYGFTDKALIKTVVAWRWLVFGGAGLLVLVLARRAGPRVLALLAVALVGLDLISLNHGFQPQSPLSQVDPPAPPSLAYLQAHQGDQRISGTYTPTSQSLLPNLGQRFGLRDLQTYDLPKPDRFTALWKGLGQPAGDLSFWSPSASGAQTTLNLFAVRYVLLGPGMRAPAWLRPVYRDADEIVAENPTALPRAWVTSSWRPASADPLAETLQSSRDQMLRRPVIQGAPGPPSSARVNVQAATLTTDENERVALQAETTKPGYLILDDAQYPGWQATVDGRPTPILRANDYFRAVRLSPGRHRIVFSYGPASVTAGAVISLISLLVVVLVPLGWWLWRRQGASGAASATSASP